MQCGCNAEGIAVGPNSSALNDGQVGSNESGNYLLLNLNIVAWWTVDRRDFSLCQYVQMGSHSPRIRLHGVAFN
jgi:hypothetical protein